MTEPSATRHAVRAPELTPSPGCPPPHPAPRTPTLALPPDSCDAHCHIFGPADVFPYDPDRTFTPVDAPKEQLFAVHAHLGLTRAVIVQSSCHGHDPRVLLDALKSGGGRLRGVALIGESTTRAEIEELHRAGVRAFRLNFLPHLRTPPTRAEIDSVLERVDGLGWAAQLHVRGEEITVLEDLVRALPGRAVVDHIGRVDLAAGRDSPALRSLRALLDTGDVWLKVSGVDRVSRQGPPYTDAVELAASLVAYAPERVLWGTDYPHVNITGDAPDDGLLVDLIERIAPDPGHLRRLMVHNPADLFDFPSTR
ncbi:amidohydrolase [Streptomyces sp. NBC_00620]|uniref:amidohydrolase family protein n=1 Tax=unclassified Streptomyces TaxID=2593676 RepID=UPI00224E9A06|nr:amidohydrolase family protein [Streptomyces sp. NBC_00620]MCX4977089.1 amidohydrolase family protein [Streptomyces sp. NBC_00620]WUC08852.1 amidohydrolase family protein [Streptomyces sp. NBC_00564]WUC54720.1 amidohydrolase family protein [Streptomyces sp. NBC_00554]